VTHSPDAAVVDYGFGVRLAVGQLNVGSNTTENLETCLRVVRNASSTCWPDLLVLPEQCNHAAAYPDRQSAWDGACDIDGEFVRAIGAEAERQAMYVSVGLTIRRDAASLGVTSTVLLFSPDGDVIAQHDKSVLESDEQAFLVPGTTAGQAIVLPLGTVGLYATGDGSGRETVQDLAARGARLLLAAISTSTTDHAHRHVPLRAAENAVFVAAAGRIGPLVPGDDADDESTQRGAGESQIVAPDGTVIARAPNDGEGIAWAEVDLADATGPSPHRRPTIYRSGEPVASPEGADRSREVCVAVAASADERALTARAVSESVATVELIVLPELTAVPDRTEHGYIVSSVREGDAHIGVIVGPNGIVHRQRTLHLDARSPWATDLVDEITVVDLGFARVALLVGADAHVPEAAHLAALAGATVIACPTAITSGWQAALGLPEAATENGLCVVAASPPSNWGRGVVCTFASGSDAPLTTYADGRVTITTIHPA
jgi:deaminated glutathione amidase